MGMDTKKPDYRKFAGDPGGFIDAMRRHHGLGYRRFADAVSARVRGKQRKGSENYFYRLCNRQTTLRPELVDGISRALDLNRAETRFLNKSIETSELREHDTDAYGKSLLKLLKTGSRDEQGAAGAFQTIIEPLFVALYTLAAKSRTDTELAPRRLAKSTSRNRQSSRKISEAIDLLVDTGLLVRDDNGQLVQANPGQDLHVRSSSSIADGPKSEAMKLYFAAVDKWGTEALYNTPREHRNFQSVTFLTGAKQLKKLNRRVEELWNEAKQQLRSEFEDADGDVVAHVGIRSWPMLQLVEQGDRGQRK